MPRYSPLSKSRRRQRYHQNEKHHQPQEQHYQRHCQQQQKRQRWQRLSTTPAGCWYPSARGWPSSTHHAHQPRRHHHRRFSPTSTTAEALLPASRTACRGRASGWRGRSSRRFPDRLRGKFGGAVSEALRKMAINTYPRAGVGACVCAVGRPDDQKGRTFKAIGLSCVTHQ